MQAASIFIAAFPKAASTFATNVLCDYTGYEEQKYAEPGLHKDLVVQRLRDASGRRHVVKQHTVALPKNVRLMREFSLRPVVLVRNVFDSLVSLSEYLGQRDRDNFLMPNIRGCDPASRLRGTVQFCAPFYVQFYVSWWRTSVSGLETCWVTYEEMLADKKAFFTRILDFYGIPSQGRLCESIAKFDVRPSNRIANDNLFNVGVAGRGERIPPHLRQHVVELCDFFPEVDFSRVGI